MSTDTAQPPSPGKARRKGPKSLPKLPLSAFSPPNTGTNDSFPLPIPSDVHPNSVIDANVSVVSSDIALTKWKQELGGVLGDKYKGIVALVPATNTANVVKELESLHKNQIVSIVLPFKLEDPDSSLDTLLSAITLPTSLSTVFTRSTPEAIAGLRWALEKGRSVDIDIQATISESDLEGFEDMITKATTDLSNTPPIILSNILPPPLDLDLPIVKLMSHPTYTAFQSQAAALSLLPGAYVKFIPPTWRASTPESSVWVTSSDGNSEAKSKQQKEWKRRIKMYLGPVLEAFGYQRIIFGSSPSASSKVVLGTGEWYNIAKESLTELGVEQEFVDAVFFENAKEVYGGK